MKIAGKLTLAYLSMSLLTLIAIGLLAYNATQKTLSEEVLFHIDHIAETQRERLENIVSQNAERLALVASRTQLRVSLANFIADSKPEYQEKINRILSDARSSVDGFKDLFVLAVDGVIVGSTDKSTIGSVYPDAELSALGKKANTVDNLYLDGQGKLGVRLVGPLKLGNSVIGVLIIESSADNIVALATNYYGLGKTGETLLVRRLEQGNVQFITPTRFDVNTSLKKYVSQDDITSPLVQSLSGENLLFADAVDYLGQPVIAATRYLSQTGWGIVVQERKSEAFAAVNELRESLTNIIFLFSLAVAVLAVVVTRSVTRPIVELTEVATRISRGDLSRRVEFKQSDEVGMLAKAFNRMTEYLVTDIRERRAAEEKFSNLLRAAPDATVIVDSAGKIVLTNIQAENLFGYSAEEIMGEPVELLMPERYRGNHQQLRASFQEQPYFRPMGHGAELYGLRKDGSEFPIEVSLSPITTDDGSLIASSVRDISERKKTEALLVHQANFDALTDLPNRAMAFDRLSQALVRAKRSKHHVALMFIDIDRFKGVNDTLGHSVGDELLIEVARRLLTCVRGDDTVARLGGDEFLVVLSDLNSVEDAEPVAEKILAAVKRSYFLDGRELFLSASIGITSYPDDGDDPHILLRYADAAMYRAKEGGRNTSRFFTPEISERLVRRLELEPQLQHAIENEELSVYYQPQVSINSLNVIGAEALLRWNNPTLGEVAPDEFITLAEDSNLILPIGEWVLKAACRDASIWQAHTGLPLRVAVNISPQQFRGNMLLETVALALEESGLPPSSLELEITENILMEDALDASMLIHELKKLGVRLALDDFGTGYSSLSYLKRFPFDVLKIDRSFVADIPNNLENVSLCKAIMAMAESLNLTVIGEGIETFEQLEFLREHGTNIAQGYYFSHPVPMNEFESLIAGSDGLLSRVAT